MFADSSGRDPDRKGHIGPPNLPPMPRLCTAGSVSIGPGKPLAIIAGPCVLESVELGLTVGRELKGLCGKLGLSYIFKASFDKANRSSIRSPRGPGMEQGLAW